LANGAFQIGDREAVDADDTFVIAQSFVQAQSPASVEVSARRQDQFDVFGRGPGR
jgi:hypothetical protein